MSEARCVWPARAVLGEGPLWSGRDCAVYWVDIKGRALHRYSLVDESLRSWKMPDLLGWVIERRDRPGFIAGFRDCFAELTLEPPAIDRIGSLEPDLPHNRLNDAKADIHGRIWAGSMDNRDPGEVTGSLYRIDPNLSWQRVDTGYGVTNGPTFSPDGTILYHADSAKRTIYCFDVALDGALLNKRAWVTLPEESHYPDGMATDVEGCVWVAVWGGGCVRRFRPDGSLDREIPLPPSQVSSCVFAGESLDRMFVTSASIGREHEPLAGSLFEVDPGVSGLPTNQFAA